MSAKELQEEEDHHPLSDAEIGEFVDAVDAANICISLEEIRYRVIAACLMQHKASLGLSEEEGEKKMQNVWKKRPAAAVEHQAASAQSALAGLGIAGV